MTTISVAAELGPAPAPSIEQRKHYHDIDGARSVLMFLSVALHAGTIYAPSRPAITSNVARADFFDWLIFGLHLFITPTFFFVGGFFAVLLLARRTPVDFLKNRFLRTAIPLIAISLTFNMLEHYLRWGDAGGVDGVGGGSILEWVGSPAFVQVWSDGTWQLHLWFLVSLFPMFILAAAIQAALPKHAKIRAAAVKLCDRFGGAIRGSIAFAFGLLFLAVISTLNYGSASLVPGGYDLLAPGFQSWYKLVGEFPMFVIGVMAALSPRLLSALTEWRWWMPFAAAAAFFFQPYASPEQGFEMGAGFLFLNQLAIWTLVLFTLQFFHRFFIKGGPRTAWLADSALTMYIFHHCFVYIYGQLLVQFHWPIAAEFIFVTLASAGTVIAIHELLVRRFGILRLLFNGKTDLDRVRSQPSLIEAFSLPRFAVQKSVLSADLSPRV